MPFATIAVKKDDVLTIKILIGRCKSCGDKIEWKFTGPRAVGPEDILNIHLCQKCFEKSTQNS